MAMDTHRPRVRVSHRWEGGFLYCLVSHHVCLWDVPSYLVDVGATEMDDSGGGLAVTIIG